jgi:hypothetical protein
MPLHFKLTDYPRRWTPDEACAMAESSGGTGTGGRLPPRPGTLQDVRDRSQCRLGDAAVEIAIALIRHGAARLPSVAEEC